MANTHALLSPSGAKRWMACAASIALTEHLPETSSSYADEGTLAHAVAEARLTLGPCPEHTSEMFNEVQKYLDNVYAFAGGGELFVECKLPIGHLTGEEDAHGTADAVIINGTELTVVDLKYGMGERVDAESNPQLMIYALGALEKYDLLGEITHVRMSIQQVRLNHFPEWSCTVEELRAFGEEVKARAKVVWVARDFKTNWERDPKAAYYQPAEDVCRWCKAKATCPALDAHIVEVIGADFEDLTEGGDIPPLDYTDHPLSADLSAKMKAVGLVEDWCKAVRAKVESDLLAGTPVPGYKLVQGKRGNRSWKNPKAAEEMLKKFRLKESEMYDFKLISPTTADKLQVAGTIGPKQWKQVLEAIEQREGKPSVAPESDERPALNMLESFEDLTGEDLI